MKKFLVISLVVVVVAGYAAYQNPRVRAWLERQTQQVVPKSATEQTLYRWKDQHGQWQISDKPPAVGIKYEIVHYPTNANVIPAERLTGKKSD